MKKYILGLLCTAVASTAWAQSPQTASVVLIPVTQGQPVPIRQVAGISYLGKQSCGSCGDAGGCTPTKVVCESFPSTKVTAKISYSSICEPVCYPKCRSCEFLSGGSSCDGCSTGNCSSTIYQKKWLVKHVTECETPVMKCMPVTVPACTTGCTPACNSPAAPATTPVPAPTAPPAKKMPTTAAAPARTAPISPSVITPTTQPEVIVIPAEPAITVTPMRQ